MSSFIRQLRVLLLGMWLGVAIFFGAAVAPALFGVLRDAGLANANELAGSIVGRLLGFINRGGFEIGLFLIVTGLVVHRHRSRLAQVAEVISTAIMAIMTGISLWIIAARMATLRASMGLIDQVPPNDSRRLEFDSLHRYSVIAMGVAIIAGMVAFMISSRPDKRRNRAL